MAHNWNCTVSGQLDFDFKTLMYYNNVPSVFYVYDRICVFLQM